LIAGDNERFDLTDDVWVERLEDKLAMNIQQACEAPHFNIRSEAYDKHLYAFVRKGPTEERSKFEGMSDLFTITALSRLVHPTSIGNRYCARVFQFPRSDSIIEAVQFRGISPDVMLSEGQRDWLSQDDGEVLRKLLPWVAGATPMHKRIHRAYWNHEYAMRSYYLDERWPLVVSGFEALISVGDTLLSAQFRERVRQLAVEFGSNLTTDEIRIAYQLRSKMVHAEGVLFDFSAILPIGQHDALYRKLEELLRLTLKRCLLDQTFADTFRDDASVEARWRFVPKAKKKKRP
jgi:hypothetical protein